MSVSVKKKFKLFRWALLLVIFGGLVAAGFGISASLKPKNDIDPSKLDSVKKGDLARSVVATGKIQPLTKVEVKSKASGIVKEIKTDYGQMVKKGDILVELDKEDLQARLREAKANLQAAQAALLASKATLGRNQVDAEGTDIPFLKKSMDRAQQLYTQGVMSKSIVEEAERAYQLAVNKQMSALQNVSVSKAEVSRAEAQVAQAQALMERSEEDLRNSTIVSPMDGIVLSKNVEVGDAVSSILVLGSQATLVATLGDISSVYVLGKVDEADVGKIYLKQMARIVVESFKDKQFTGEVTKISPLGIEKDNVTTFEVRVSIQNPSLELKANMSANAEIILEERKNVLLIPESAVVYDKDRNTFAETPDKSVPEGKRKIAIKTGISNGVKTEVLNGLSDGQSVILQ